MLAEIKKVCGFCLEKVGKIGIFFRRGDMNVTCSSCGGPNLLLTEVKVVVVKIDGEEVEIITPQSSPVPILYEQVPPGDKAVYVFNSNYPAPTPGRY